MKVLHLAATRNSEASAAWRIMNAQRELGIDAQALVQENRFSRAHTNLLLKPEGKSNYRTALKRNSLLARISHHNKPRLPWSYNYTPSSNWSDIAKLDFEILNIHWVPSVLDLNNIALIKKPIVFTLHDVWPLTGGCHCNLDCVNWKTGCEECPQISKLIPNFLTASTNWFSKKESINEITKLAVAAPSNWIASMARESPIFAAREIQVVPNCVDSRIFQPTERISGKQKLGLESTKFHLLFVVSGDVSQYHKGFDLFVKVIDRLLETRLESRLEIIIVGKSSNIHKSKWSGRIKHFGQIDSQEQMRDIYSAADVMISTSRQDNLPNTLIEASFCGIPIVAFDIGGIKDIVTPGLNGSLIEMGNVVDFALAIEKLSFQHLNPKEIFSDAKSKFSFTNSAQKYAALYNNLLK